MARPLTRALWAIVRHHPVRQVRWTVWRTLRRETLAGGTVPLAELLIASGAIW